MYIYYICCIYIIYIYIYIYIYIIYKSHVRLHLSSTNVKIFLKKLAVFVISGTEDKNYILMHIELMQFNVT